MVISNFPRTYTTAPVLVQVNDLRVEEDTLATVRIARAAMGCIILCEVVWCKVNANYTADGITLSNLLVLCIQGPTRRSSILDN